jgi:hypothetical protein
MGYRNPTTRYLRIGAFVLVLLAGSLFHHSGGTYTVIRYAYYALIIGLLVMSFRSRRGLGRGMMGGRQAPPGQGFPTSDPRQNPVASSLAAPGWFPDSRELNLERYWDGMAWTRQRRFDGTNWVEE